MMENPAPEKSVTFFTVRNTYKYIEDYLGARGKMSKPRNSVDLEQMFFGKHNEDDDDDDDEDDSDTSDTSENEETMSGQLGRRSADGKSQSEASSTAGDGRSSKASSVADRGVIPTPSSSDLMSRFYARLQELKETKEEDERTTTNNTDVFQRNRDRKRIKTALRRLLNERLFPEESAPKRSKTAGAKLQHGNADGSEGLISGSVSPITLGSRSKTFSVKSRQGDDGESTRANTRLGTQSRVVFTGEQMMDADTDGNRLSNGQHGEEETVPYYRRHPLGPLKYGQVSRLYRPAMASRSRTALSQGSLHLEGLRKDKDFLQRLQGKQGQREDTRMSLPAGRGTQASQSNFSEENPSNSDRYPWRREKSNLPWTYNLPPSQPKARSQTQMSTDFVEPRGRLKLKHLDDWRLKKLLEELYTDKKYMDKLINTKEKDETEEEVSTRLESGREYLLQRALFWLERGPLPPRPPTTELGYRLQRSQTASSQFRNQQLSPENQNNTPENQNHVDEGQQENGKPQQEQQQQQQQQSQPQTDEQRSSQQQQQQKRVINGRVRQSSAQS